MPKIKNSRVPEEMIPLVALHWGNEWWYGSGMSPQDMRKFFEKRLRNAVETKMVIAAWVRQAEGWKIISDSRRPGLVDQQLREYHYIRLVA